MILKIIYGLIILGIIVFIHEMGHFLASIACGVKVEAFSIGFGPVLLHKTIKNVDWRLSLLPLGGYCAMKGEDALNKALGDNVNEITGDPDSLYGVHPLKRAFIAFAGPFFNLITAFLAFVIISMTGYSYWTMSNEIRIATEVYPELHSAAFDAGLRTGDKIIKINKSEISDFSDIYSIVASHPDEDLIFVVERPVKKASTSEENDSTSSSFETLTFTVHTDLNKENGTGKIGVLSNGEKAILKEARRYGFFGAVKQGVIQCGEMIQLTIQGIGTLFKGVKVTEAVSGPASITTMLGDAVETGFTAGFRNGLANVLNFVALICISLFLMNLLPIPVLDGGLILFSLIETVFRTSISPKVRYRVQYIGLAFIAFMFVIAVMGDFHYFMRLFNEK